MVTMAQTATLSYTSGATFSSLRVYSPLTTVETLFHCNIQPSNGRYILNDDGDKIVYKWMVHANIFKSNLNKLPDNTILKFFGEDHKIEQIFPYESHVEFKCH